MMCDVMRRQNVDTPWLQGIKLGNHRTHGYSYIRSMINLTDHGTSIADIELNAKKFSLILLKNS